MDANPSTGNDSGSDGQQKPEALSLLVSERPRNLNSFGAGALLFGDWGTSRLYVLGLAFLVAGRSSFYLILAMSLLILAVGWAYTQICRIYPDGGGVYTAGRRRSPLLGVVGALLLFADYTITASLSAVEAFHYFGLGDHPAHVQSAPVDAGDDIRLDTPEVAKPKSDWSWNSPGLWAIVAIVALGAFNLMGPKHSAGFALFAAGGMVLITVMVAVLAIPQIPWWNLGELIGRLNHRPTHTWEAFVAIVLALSGVEAIANLTGVMKKPVYKTASRSIWVVAGEVALFNLILALAMVSITGLGREAHKEDMLAFMAKHYGMGVAAWFAPVAEWSVRIIGGLLLLSATNTAVNGLMSVLYVMSRDNEMPRFFQKLNGFGAPWIGAVVAAGVPAIVLIFFHDLQTLAHLYAIGIVGAVAIDCSLNTFHPRLRKTRRKVAMGALALLLIAIWITLAVTKWEALIFVTIVMIVGLGLRQLTKWAAARRPKPSLLRQAIIAQLTPEALARPRLMLSTAGSSALADSALAEAAAEDATLVVCFIREVALNYKIEAETRLTFDNDPAAQEMFAEFLDKGHAYGVPIIPVYDAGPHPAEAIAELAAMNGVEKLLIGSSRRGALHHIIKGSFQRKLESLLPPEIHVQVIALAHAKPSERSDADEESETSAEKTEG
ncbi:MAG TPA: universal stress protein [Tepidisphaeraceae bacterium]|nr:universal stress protein [Tepidisphaeraceae bacterium]